MAHEQSMDKEAMSEKELASELFDVEQTIVELVEKRGEVLRRANTKDANSPVKKNMEKVLSELDNTMSEFTKRRAEIRNKLEAIWEDKDMDDDEEDGVYFNLEDLKKFVRQRMQEEWPQVEAALMVNIKRMIDEVAAKWNAGPKSRETADIAEKGMLCLGNFCGLYDGALECTLDRKLLKDCYGCACGHLCLQVTQVRIQSKWNEEGLRGRR